MQTHNEHYVIDLIQKQNAFAKIISASLYSDRCLNYFLNQLEDPAHNRPLKKIENVHRHRFFDPRDGQWYYRAIEDVERGQPKNTIFTKKTSVFLLPHDGVIHFFTPKHGHPVGLIFDVQLCDLKGEKYIFPYNANTDSKWWLKRQYVHENNHFVRRSTTLNQLRQNLIADRRIGIIPEWNDILAGLSLESLTAVFAPINQLSDRIKALYVKQTILSKFKKDLPLLIITPEEGIGIYNLEWQKRDIKLASGWDNIEFPIEFMQKLHKQVIGEDKSQDIQTKNNIKISERKIIREFFIGDRFPRELKQSLLYFLSLVDLLKIKAALKDNLIFAEITSFVDNAIQHNRLLELCKIIAILNQQSISAFLMNIGTSDDYQIIFNKNESVFSNFLKANAVGFYRKEYLELKSDFTERVMGHIFYGSNTLTKEALTQSLKYNNQPLVSLLLDLGSDPFFEMQNWNIFYNIIRYADLDVIRRLLRSHPHHNSLKSNVDLVDHYEGVKNIIAHVILSPLLIAALFRDLNVLKELTREFSSDVTHALKNLNVLETTYNKWHFAAFDNKEISFSFDSQNPYYPIPALNNARVKLLLQLKSQQLYHYKMSYDEKRLVENYLITRIQKLQTKKEIESFWSEHKDALYLNQTRHPWLDRFLFFRGSDYMPKIKQHVLAALEKRAIAIDTSSAENSSSPASGRGCPEGR